MIERLYSEFDSDITIRANEGKTFNENRIDYKRLMLFPGVKQYSRAVEEVIILKHEKKWVNANLIGVDSAFLEMSKMSKHMVDGKSILSTKNDEFGIIGATLLDKLDGYIPGNVGFESLICYVPRRDMRIQFGKNPFKTKIIKVAGRMNYNREVNSQNFIIPLESGRELLDYKNQVSAIYVDCINGEDKERIKIEIATLTGDFFNVKTSYEKNELIYKTSKSEKIIVLIILLFIFILAAFNLIASITMLFVEKLENIKTLISLGARRDLIFKIFFFEGILIAGKGILIGSLIGYAVSFAQLQFEFITMPNSGGESFPINVTWTDGLLILSLVSTLSILFSFLPVKYLIRRNIDSSE